MRLKFRQEGIDVVITVTNVHYCKHQSAVYGYNPNDETDEFGNIYKCGLSVLQQDATQTKVMLFAGISRMDCNDIVDELLKYGYADISDYDYTDILLIQD